MCIYILYDYTYGKTSSMMWMIPWDTVMFFGASLPRGFLQWGYPQSSSILDWEFLISTNHFGVPPLMETSICTYT